MIVSECGSLLGLSVDTLVRDITSEAWDSSAPQRMVLKNKLRQNLGQPYTAFCGANLAHGHTDQTVSDRRRTETLISGSALWQQGVEATLATREDQYLFYDCGKNKLHSTSQLHGTLAKTVCDAHM